MERRTRTAAFGCLAMLAVFLAACISAPAASGDGSDGLATEKATGVTVLNNPEEEVFYAKSYYVACDMKITDMIASGSPTLYMQKGTTITVDDWRNEMIVCLAASIDGDTVEFYSGLCIHAKSEWVSLDIYAGDGFIELYRGSCLVEKSSCFGIKVTGSY